MNKRQGGCRCGDIRYETSGEPQVVYYCHCRDCQRSTGSAFHVGLVMKQDQVAMLSGKPKGHTTTSDSGHEMTREFCSNCGSPLFTRDQPRKDRGSYLLTYLSSTVRDTEAANI